jgi:hypothetical protein
MIAFKASEVLTDLEVLTNKLIDVSSTFRDKHTFLLRK